MVHLSTSLIFLLHGCSHAGFPFSFINVSVTRCMGVHLLVPLSTSVMFLSPGVWVFSTLLPTLLLNSKKKDRALTTRDYVGWGMWSLGFIFEVVADYQKSRFKANPENAVSIETRSLTCTKNVMQVC